MKRLLFSTLFLASVCATAQTTHNLDWFMGISQAAASLQIDEGDTVVWTFTDSAPHTVTNSSGSAEPFDSEQLPAGSTYSHTFTVVGDNPYFCGVHPSMVGVITVNALGMEENSIRNFALSPNPASVELHLVLPGRIENAQVIVYDVLGKMILNQEISTLETKINISGWSSGIYLVKVGNGTVSTTKRFIKK